MHMFIGHFFKESSNVDILKVLGYLMELGGPRERHTHVLRHVVVHFDNNICGTCLRASFSRRIRIS